MLPLTVEWVGKIGRFPAPLVVSLSQLTPIVWMVWTLNPNSSVLNTAVARRSAHPGAHRRGLRAAGQRHHGVPLLSKGGSWRE